MIAEEELIMGLKIIPGARIALPDGTRTELTTVIIKMEEEIEEIVTLAILLIMTAENRLLMIDMTESPGDTEESQDHLHLIEIVRTIEIETIKTRTTDTEEDMGRIAEKEIGIDQDRDRKTPEIEDGPIVIRADHPKPNRRRNEEPKARRGSMTGVIKIERKTKNKIRQREEVSTVKSTAQILREVEMIIE